MKTNKKIRWQKYEDVIESQIKSPLASMLINSFLDEMNKDEDLDDEKITDEPILMAAPESLSNEIQLLANFDCWIGHTNFNLTEEIKNHLNKIEGIEVLKICSRYRFFIGIGKMFDFKSVREDIENKLMLKETVYVDQRERKDH